MPTVHVTVSSPVPTSFRAARVEGQFDIPHQTEQTLTFSADLSACEDQPWSVGAIVGASGRGKSTLARALWPREYRAAAHPWSADCLLDDFPEAMSADDIVGALTSVGFSSPPAWLRPYRVLSTGQQHRADLARSLVGEDELVVVDEFTSVVDRTVAASLSAAVARHVRRAGRRFVAVTCHRDVLEWLEVDWYYDLDENRTHWGRLHRPHIRLHVREGSRSAWSRFRGHHYLTGQLHNAARVFLAYVQLGDDTTEHLVGFFSLLPVAGHRGWWRGHRTVVLPDYQGLGIGNAMIEAVAEQLWRREQKRFRATTSARSLIAHRRRHPEMWRLTMAPKMKAAVGKTSTIKGMASSVGRLTTTWVYVPEELRRSPSTSATSEGHR
jgi:energy-coupling factor transporter ATP-binding protein EcfA2